MKIALVVALGKNNEIGANGTLLWHLPKDMKQFKEITMGHHVLMGRKTYESIPEKFRPLPGRVNIVLTSNQSFSAPNCIIVHTLKQGIEIAQAAGEKELMVIGGGEIYKHTMPIVDILYLTKVAHSFPQADTFLPQWDEAEFEETEHLFFSKDDKHAYDFQFVKLEKRNRNNQS